MLCEIDVCFAPSGNCLKRPHFLRQLPASMLHFYYSICLPTTCSAYSNQTIHIQTKRVTIDIIQRLKAWMVLSIVAEYFSKIHFVPDIQYFAVIRESTNCFSGNSAVIRQPCYPGLIANDFTQFYKAILHQRCA